MSLHEDLKAYLDGELEETRAEELKIALERDPGLRRELSELKSLSVSLQVNAAEIVPIGLERTLAALDKEQASRSALLRPWLWTCGIAATAVLAIVVVLPLFAHSADDAAKDTASAPMVAMNSKADKAASAVEKTRSD